MIYCRGKREQLAPKGSELDIEERENSWPPKAKTLGWRTERTAGSKGSNPEIEDRENS